MNVGELCDIVIIDWHLETAWLGDESCHILKDGQLVASLTVGGHYIATVRNGDVGQAWLVGVLLGVLIAVFEDNAFKGFVFGCGLFIFGANNLN